MSGFVLSKSSDFDQFSRRTDIHNGVSRHVECVCLQTCIFIISVIYAERVVARFTNRAIKLCNALVKSMS